MSYDTLISLIQQFGYAALFFALWLGIVGMPIPDEVVVMTGGAVTVGGLLHPLPAFILTYLGVVSGLSLGYVLGRYVGTPVIDRMRGKKKMNKYLDFSETLVQKYGSLAIGISYFFPIIRHVMPYVVGVHRMTFKRYSLFSYTTGLLWTFLFFMAGRFAWEHVEDIGYLFYHYGLKLLWLPFVLIAVFLIIRISSNYRKIQRRD